MGSCLVNTCESFWSLKILCKVEQTIHSKFYKVLIRKFCAEQQPLMNFSLMSGQNISMWGSQAAKQLRIPDTGFKMWGPCSQISAKVICSKQRLI